MHARALLAALALATFGCGPRPTDEPPGHGLLVIVVDALRADHLGAYGYDRATMPQADQLAAQGALFLDAWSASPEVLPAHGALLTGCDPLLARAPVGPAVGPASELSAWSLPEGVPSLAQALLAHGYETAAFVDHPSLAPIRGVARGFQTFQGFREDAVDPEMELGMEGVATKFLRWLGGLRADADWFAYLHVNDLERQWSRRAVDSHWDTLFAPRPELDSVPAVAEAEHAYFAIPRPRWSGGSRSLGEYEARYDGALRNLSSKLARVMTRLARDGRLETTTIVLVGSYGVSLGENGLYVDSGELSAADLRVPWIVKLAPSVEAARGVRVGGMASLIDFAPTMLDLAGVPVPAGMQGSSLAACVKSGAPTGREIAFASGGFHRGRAAIDARWTLVERRPDLARIPELAKSWLGTDAPADAVVPRELAARTLDAGDPSDARARLGRELDAWFGWIDRARPLLHGRARPEADAALANELRRLGWLVR